MNDPIDFNKDGKLDKGDVKAFAERTKASWYADPWVITFGYGIAFVVGFVLAKMKFPF